MLLSMRLAALGIGLAAAAEYVYPPYPVISYRSYAEMSRYLLELNASFPDVVQVSIAQETFGLPYPEELQCQVDDDTHATEPCKQFVVHLTNHSTLAEDPERPEVFISGALHGNERVGPAAAIELIALVAHATSQFAEDSAKPTADTQRWLKQLVNSRNVLITPMTNAYGYAHNKREELSVDPNRDYNYMRSGKECMQAMTSRVVNEIWREHVFQLAVTFHGGTRAVSYEWGSPDHYLDGDEKKPSEKSPDHMAQFQIGNTLANFAGKFPDGKLYPVGTMNDVVYGVTGGMEDWGYAASWENQFYESPKDQPFHPCEPTTFGGYPKEKTVYNNMTNRAFNMLVETSHSKEPRAGDLGNQKELYGSNVDFFRTDGGNDFVGHVPRNVRLALMMIEMAQPLVRWVDTTESSTTQDATQLAAFPSANLYRTDSNVDQVTEMGCGAFAWERKEVATCDATDCAVTDSGHSKVQIGWEVLGALTVDSTHVQISSSPKFEKKNILMETSVQKGTTRRFYEFASDSSQAAAANVDTLGTSLFVTCLDLKNSTSEKLYVRAVATVDQDWKTQGSGADIPSPDVPPQSHLVNARTNPDWDFEWNGHRVKSSLEWTSPVITVSKSGVLPSETTTSATSLSANTTVAADESDSEDSSDEIVEPRAKSTEAPATKDEDESEDSSDDVAAPTASPSTKIPKTIKAKIKDDEETEDESEDSEEEKDTTLDDEMKASDDEKSSKTSVPSTTSTEDTTALAATGSNGQDKGSSLLQFGYLIMSSCAMIIVLTVAYLYRRVFRRPRQPYINISSLEQSTRAAISSLEDDEEYAVDSDEDEDSSEGPRIGRHAHTSQGVL